jgi:hypothetical protein
VLEKERCSGTSISGSSETAVVGLSGGKVLHDCGEHKKLPGNFRGSSRDRIFKMKKTKETEETELEFRKTKYPQLRVATGGRMPPEGPTEPPDAFNWLSGMDVGVTFVASPRGSNSFEFNLYHVLFKLPEVILLKWILPDGKMLDHYVDPVLFSKRFNPGVILGKQEAPEGDKDGNSNRSD